MLINNDERDKGRDTGRQKTTQRQKGNREHER